MIKVIIIYSYYTRLIILYMMSIEHIIQSYSQKWFIISINHIIHIHRMTCFDRCHTYRNKWWLSIFNHIAKNDSSYQWIVSYKFIVWHLLIISYISIIRTARGIQSINKKNKKKWNLLIISYIFIIRTARGIQSMNLQLDLDEDIQGGVEEAGGGGEDSSRCVCACTHSYIVEWWYWNGQPFMGGWGGCVFLCVCAKCM